MTDDFANIFNCIACAVSINALVDLALFEEDFGGGVFALEFLYLIRAHKIAFSNLYVKSGVKLDW